MLMPMATMSMLVMLMIVAVGVIMSMLVMLMLCAVLMDMLRVTVLMLMSRLIMCANGMALLGVILHACLLCDKTTAIERSLVDILPFLPKSTTFGMHEPSNKNGTPFFQKNRVRGYNVWIHRTITMLCWAWTLRPAPVLLRPRLKSWRFSIILMSTRVWTRKSGCESYCRPIKS